MRRRSKRRREFYARIISMSIIIIKCLTISPFCAKMMAQERERENERGPACLELQLELSWLAGRQSISFLHLSSKMMPNE